jgi:hypothetical protein
LIVTGHTPNLLPGVSVMAKIRAADVFIVMDDMQYEAKGFCNRNRFSGGSWMTVPVASKDVFKPFRDVRIADPTGRAREKVARTLEARMGARAAWYATILRGRDERLIDLTTCLLAQMCSDLDIESQWLDQSDLAAGAYRDVSEGLAAMVAEVGGTVWLSGPSGRKYLDESPFAARGIEVRYHVHEGPNPCALELLTKEAAREAA